MERCLAGDADARLTPGVAGEFVALVQQALIDLGEPLSAGGADGRYGRETTAAVLGYKTRRDIKGPDGSVDGVVGSRTMAALDEECTARDQIPGPCPPAANGPSVDLRGTDERLVNMVLAHTMAATVVGADGSGGTRLITSGVPIPETLARNLVDAATHLLHGRGVRSTPRLAAALGELAVIHADAGQTELAHALADGALWPSAIHPGTALAHLLTRALTEVAPSASTSVRDLSKTSALAEAADHALSGRITLTPSPMARIPDPKGMFAVPATVAGVTFKATAFGDKRLPSYRPVATPLEHLDIRHVVGLVRFAVHLSTKWGVTEVHHAGISGDRRRADCHGNGRATDFVGAVGRNPADGLPFHLTVFNDWKNRSVPDLHDPSTARRPDWPPGSGKIRYRLADLPGVDPLARDFFADLYAWVAGEYQDITDGPGQVGLSSAIGESSRIMTPDHPDSQPGSPNGREAHHSHMHWQVGPTGPQAL
ncbi:hypothetical protein Ssi02_51690 [Sinosporangium siamense]|uniref:Peptidoglycan binding-like domain-containing protein n=1 Tax=Sinosporangium siamense TaxID=1367973 RepID=A0A919V8Z3_9ACTN|nr:hypothetical protein Ssi02_51690 [Sinosporangium siamense]